MYKNFGQKPRRW